MSGLRKRRSGGHVTLSREVAQNADLSFRARGVLVYLWSKPEGWDVRAAAIAADGKEGREAILSTLRELGAAGHYRRVRLAVTVPGKGIRWVTETEVSDEPVQEWIDEWAAKGDEEVIVGPESENPSSGAAEVSPESGNPDVGDPAVGQPDALPSSSETELSKRTTSPSPDGEDGCLFAAEDVPPQTTPRPGISNPPGMDFNDFYAAYPKHVGRAAAEKAWRKAIDRRGKDLTVAQAVAVIVDGARRFAADPNLPKRGTPDWQYVPHPASWLNAGRWADEPLPERGRRNGNLHVDEGRGTTGGEGFN